MGAHVHLQRDGDVVIDNPPINAGSTEVRRGLVSRLGFASGDLRHVLD